MSYVKYHFDGIRERKNYKDEFKLSTESEECFVSDYVDYFSGLTDAPWSYHELMAFICLSTATGMLRFDVGGTIRNLRTNLYCLFIGPSSTSRKSTCAKFASTILEGGLGADFQISPNFTPGGLQEDLSERPLDASVLFLDEFQGTWEEMNKHQFMIGTRKMFLSLYDTGDYAYRRTNKGSGKKKEKDLVKIQDVSLIIAGLATEDILDHIGVKDISDGFLARFCICYPFTRPEEESMFSDGLSSSDTNKEYKLSSHLHKLYIKCHSLMELVDDGTIKSAVVFEDSAIKEMVKFEKYCKKKYCENEIMLTVASRMVINSIKFAAILSASMSDLSSVDPISVEKKHLQYGIKMAKKMLTYSNRVVDSASGTWIEKHIKLIVNYLTKMGGKASRSQLIRALNVTSRSFNDITLTMADMHLIYSFAEKMEGSNKETHFFALREYNRETGKMDWGKSGG